MESMQKGRVGRIKQMAADKTIAGRPGNAGILPAPGFAGFQPASRRQEACVPRDFAVLLEYTENHGRT